MQEEGLDLARIERTSGKHEMSLKGMCGCTSKI